MMNLSYLVPLILTVGALAKKKECDKTVICAYFNPGVALRTNVTYGEDDLSPPGSYVAAGELGACSDVKCRQQQFKCLYGQDNAPSNRCPAGDCGTHNILCKCLSLDTVIHENDEYKKTMLTLGVIFIPVYLAIISCLYCCLLRVRRARAENRIALQQNQQRLASMPQPQITTIAVTVPPGMAPGQLLNVAHPQMPGATVQATIPMGMAPGSTFHIQVAVPAGAAASAAPPMMNPSAPPAYSGTGLVPAARQAYNDGNVKMQPMGVGDVAMGGRPHYSKSQMVNTITRGAVNIDESSTPNMWALSAGAAQSQRVRYKMIFYTPGQEMVVTRPLQVELHDIADTVRDANVRMVTDMVMRAEEGIQGAQPIFHSATTMNARKADALRQYIRQVLHEHAKNTGQKVNRNQLTFKINLRNIEDTAKQNQQGRMKPEYEDAHIGKAYIMWASIDCITALGASNAFFGRELKVDVPGSTAYTTRFEQDEKNMGAVLVNKRGDASGTIAEAEAELNKAKDMMEAAAAGRLFSVTHLAGVGADTSRERLVHRLSDLQVQAHIVDSER
eukprot:g5123.t1